MFARAALLASSASCSLYTGHDPTPHSPPDAAASTFDYGAACMAPRGPAVTVAVASVPTILNGRWWRCGGADEFLGHHVEFTLDQHFYDLTQQGGSFVRNLGPDTSGTYTVNASSSGITISINVLWASGGGPGYPLVGNVDTMPRTMALGGGGYVAIP